MTATPLIRLGSADVFANSQNRLGTRQLALSRQQDNISAGKRVVRASDDPASAAQAERARAQTSRLDAEKRALAAQKNTLTTAESTLGDAGTVMQRVRELVVQAGNTTLSGTDRASIAQELEGLRDQLFSLANTKDSNGLPVFGGLGSADAPFAETASGVVYNGLVGQNAATGNSVPQTLDGYAAWMSVPTGNGVFTVTQATSTTSVVSDQGQVTNPSALTGHNYAIQFSVTGTTTTYSVVDTTTSTTLQAAQPYTAGQTITFDGQAIVVKGTPANGDTLNVAPSTRDNLFDTLDRTIGAIKNGSNGPQQAHDIARALTEIDTGSSRLLASRGQAGELLSRADTISAGQDGRSAQLQTQLSNAEDLDMVKAIADFQTQQTAYSAALQTYAQIQKLSLFNFLS